MTDLEFLIIGTQKAGTTSLYEYISEHPEIYVPQVKEIQYFVDDRFYEQGPVYLDAFYKGATADQAKGLAYVHMLPFADCPSRVVDFNSKMKLVIMLREPIKRAFSAYNFAMKNGWEEPKVSFLKSFELERKRLNGNFTERFELAYFHNGLYHQHLTNWLTHFPKDQLLIITDSDLKHSRAETLKKVFGFLGVCESADINLEVEHNKAGGVKNAKLQKALLDKEAGWKRKLGGVVPKPVKVALRANVIKPMMEWNKTEEVNRAMTQEEIDRARTYFEEDLKALKRDFNISF